MKPEEVKLRYGRRSNAISLYGRCFAFGSWRGREQASLPKLLLARCRFAYSSPNYRYQSCVLDSHHKATRIAIRDRGVLGHSHSALIASTSSSDMFAYPYHGTRALNTDSPTAHTCRLLTQPHGPKLGRRYAIEPSSKQLLGM